jgi:riboflavin biosynthesis pyrimidine reductase
MTLAARPRVEFEPLVRYVPRGGVEYRGGALPAALHDAYGTDLWIPLRSDRPTVIANFVSTIDGVTSFNIPKGGGGSEVSGKNNSDRFLMGLLRSVSDAILVGAGTVRRSSSEPWAAGTTQPEAAADFAQLRSQLGLATEPTTVVVSKSGDLDLSRHGLQDASVPVVVATSDAGLSKLQRQAPFAPHVEVAVADDVVQLLQDRGLRLVLCEGGPHLMGELFRGGRVDELFLTLAPQVAGRSDDNKRLGLVEGHAFSVAGAPWSRLVDLRKSGDHLFARYRFREVWE